MPSKWQTGASFNKIFIVFVSPSDTVRVKYQILLKLLIIHIHCFLTLNQCFIIIKEWCMHPLLRGNNSGCQFRLSYSYIFVKCLGPRPKITHKFDLLWSPLIAVWNQGPSRNECSRTHTHTHQGGTYPSALCTDSDPTTSKIIIYSIICIYIKLPTYSIISQVLNNWIILLLTE